MKILFGLFVIGIVFLSGCISDEIEQIEKNETEKPNETELIVLDRESKIPSDAVKVTPETDMYPPQLHSDEYEDPVPLPYPINTAGAEDSAFITPDGNDFYFVFVPDVEVPVEKQIIDGVTGMYWSKKENGEWTKPERIILNDDISLDGCQFVQGNTMWFCSVRAGNYREVDLYTAEYVNGKWTNWKNVGEKLNVEYEVGEMHIAADGNELYFHSPREGGKGIYDIWVSKKLNGEWQEPENVDIVNTEKVDGWPFVTEDGSELWFTRTYMGSPAIYKSEKVDGEWQEPELILSQFAAEPSLDNEGNIYFAHHFFENGTMIEADMYVAYKK